MGTSPQGSRLRGIGGPATRGSPPLFTPASEDKLMRHAVRLGRSWWHSGLGGGEVQGVGETQQSDANFLASALCSSLASACLSGRVTLGERHTPALAPVGAAGTYVGPDLLRTLPADLVLRLGMFYLDPRSLASLACTCRRWRAVTLGADSVWHEKLEVLESVWPAARLSPTMLEYYALEGSATHGEGPASTLWLRRYARAQLVANKLSCASSCEVAGARGFQTRLFTDQGGGGGGGGGGDKAHRKAGWDLLPGLRCGSAYPTVARCHSVDAFSVAGSVLLQPGSYLLRWRVRSSPGAPGRPALRVTCSATTSVQSQKTTRATTAAAAAAATAAGLGATTLAVVTAGLAAPLVIAAAAAASVVAGGAMAATLASNLLTASRSAPALLLPARASLFQPDVGPGGDAVRLAQMLALPVAAGVMQAPRLQVEGVWRLDLEGELDGWRYVNVALLQLATPCVVCVGIQQKGDSGAVCALAVDYAEFVSLNEDVFRCSSAQMDPVDVEAPARVDFDKA